MATIHVTMNKDEVEPERLAGKTVVVLDVLFATSTIVTALAHGALEVCPALDRDEALGEAARREPGSYLLSGEHGAETLRGFASPMPLALLEERIDGRTLIYSTTNGTVALRRSAGAARVYAAALLNAAAVAERVSRSDAHGIVIVCAGTRDRFNLEDFYGAGYLVSLLARARPRAYDLSDAALAARLLHDGSDALECLARGRVGRMMRERGLDRDVAFAAQKDRFDVVPELASAPPGPGGAGLPVLRGGATG